MPLVKQLQTSEFVGSGHPDKVADTISESLHSHLVRKHGNHAQAAIEVIANKGFVGVAGEYKVKTRNDEKAFLEQLPHIVKHQLNTFGYDEKEFLVFQHLQQQSDDIRSASINEEGLLPGDQCIVTGFANDDPKTQQLPLSYVVARDIVKKLEEKGFPYVSSSKDSKCLICLKENRKLNHCTLSVHVNESEPISRVRHQIKEEVILPVFGSYGIDFNPAWIYINPKGNFHTGGLLADTGVTNRKLMVDTYGTIARHGGGGLCGKDLTKIDRLAAYLARWICKHLTAAGVCSYLELDLVYRFGFRFPTISIYEVQKEKLSINCIRECIRQTFLEPYPLDKLRDKFNQFFIEGGVVSYGHFGWEKYPWEKIEPEIIQKIEIFLEKYGKNKGKISAMNRGEKRVEKT